MLNPCITTLLSDITPEVEQYLNSIPEQDPVLPEHAYPITELLNTPVAIHRSCTDIGSLVPLHTHNFYEQIFCRHAGNLEYLIGTHRYQIHAGDLILIPPGVPHRPILSDRRTASFIRDELWVRSDFADQFGKRMSVDFLTMRQTPYLFRPDASWQAQISLLFQKGVEESQLRQFRWDNALEGYAQLLMVSIARAILDESTQLLQRENDSLFDRIVTYLEENLDQKITLEDTAARFFVSKSTVNRVFQKHMGTSFYRCLTQRRLLAAQQMILEGAALETVSVNTGFSDYATFYRAFRQEYGISPRQFRKNLQTYPEPSVKAGDLRFEGH